MAMTTTAAMVVLLSVLHKNFPYSQVDYTEVGILGLTLKYRHFCLLPRGQIYTHTCALNCCLPEDFFVLILGLDLMM